eukprot:TRINITY_DN15218_c0_g1_i1.p1 TRINITY_DN15218_c0_g1~~TRINITY_DN15218_c0_g1_i1.p1  ORF type:complete len:293 (+),score=91.08 TRINITY_DN15218_c0_g1_i1:158-1036(+)
MKSSTILSLIALIAPALGALSPLAAESNLFLNQNINCSYIEIRGRATIGGNANLNTVQVGCQIYSPDNNCQWFGSQTCSMHPGASPVLRVGGDLNAVNSQVFGGSVTYGGQLISAPQVVSDCTISQVVGASYSDDFSSVRNYSDALTAQYASQAKRGTVINGGNLVLQGNGSAVESFFIGYQETANIYAITLENIADSSSVIIFAGGATWSVANVGFNGQFYNLANKIIWVFPSIVVTIRETSFYGSILAPSATLLSSNAELNGQVFAQSYSAFTSNGQCSRVNLRPFTGSV